jgi:YD repeat-containing protein
MGVTPRYFSGKSRVGTPSDPAEPSTAVSLLTDDDTNLTVDLTVGADVIPAPVNRFDETNVSYYLRYDIAAGNASPSEVVVTVNGSPTEFGVVRVPDDGRRTSTDYDRTGNLTSDNTTGDNTTSDGANTSVNASGELYVALLVPNATGERITVHSPMGTDIEGVYDDEEEADRENRGAARGGPPVGPYNGTPPGAEPFSQTRTIGPDQIEGDNQTSLSGKVRVESQYATNASIELLNNTEDNATLAIDVSGNATDVTFYINEAAIKASQNIDNLTLTIDGQPETFGRVEAQGAWVAFEVDHFSTRIVSMSTSATTFSSSLPGAAAEGPPTDVDGDGTFEDINGDGQFTFTDVISLVFADFDAINANLSSSQIAAIDFDGDGQVDFRDVIDLVFQL